MNNVLEFAPYYLRVKQAGKNVNPKTLSYIIKRVLLAVLTVWIVLTITFFVMHFVPGGPFASEKAVTPAVQAALEAKYGLDKPLMEQYWTYLVDAFTKKATDYTNHYAISKEYLSVVENVKNEFQLDSNYQAWQYLSQKEVPFLSKEKQDKLEAIKKEL